MARRRVNFEIIMALAALTGGAPLAAQSTTANTAATPPATPPPASTAVGPPQLRDFNLNGTVTQPAQEPATTPVPITRAPAPVATVPNGAVTTRAPTVTAPPPAPVTRLAPTPRSPAPAGPDRNPSGDAVTVDLPPATSAPVMAAPSFSEPVPASPAITPRRESESPVKLWPWLAAVVAFGLGAAFLSWRRRQGQNRALQAADNASLGAIAPRAIAPQPSPNADPPVQPRAPGRGPALTPTPPQPARPAAQAVFAPIPRPAPTPQPAPIGVVASGLKPRIELELVPHLAEADPVGGGALTFDIVLVNRGSAPARDVLIDTRVINAGPRVDAEVGRFFLQTPDSGERIAVIAPMSRAAVGMRLVMPAEDIAPLIVDGRKLLVPVIAVNATYRWSGGELIESSSFLVGRGDAEEGKLAPFRLDLGARRWVGLAARLHSSGLQR